MRNLDNIKLGIDAYIKLNGYTRASFAKKHSIDKVAFRCLKYGSTTNIPEIIQEKIFCVWWKKKMSDLSVCSLLTFTVH